MKEIKWWELDTGGDDKVIKRVNNTKIGNEKKFLGVWDGPKGGNKTQMAIIVEKYEAMKAGWQKWTMNIYCLTWDGWHTSTCCGQVLGMVLVPQAIM